MVAVQAFKLLLPDTTIKSSSSSSTIVTSVLYEPTSHSLALVYSDSSCSLHPNTPLLSSHFLPPPQTLIPPAISSSSFVLLQNHRSPTDGEPDGDSPRVLFVASGPHRGGSQLLFRFFLLKSGKFVRARVVCKQKDLNFDANLGVLFRKNHGVSIRISGSVNYFAVYSISCSRVWLFGVRMVNDGAGSDDDDAVKLMRCAVIECSRPIWCMSLSFGLLILGEENGLRVFNLMGILKGASKKVKHVSSKLKGGKRFPNGVRNGFLQGENERPQASEKQRSLKLKQDFSDENSYFVALERSCKDLESTSKPTMSLKATSIQSLCPEKFVICDSIGDLHLLCLAKSNAACRVHLKPIPHIMKVQHVATFPDISLSAQNFWIGDGSHSMHMMVECESEAVVEEDGDRNVENAVHLSVVQAIFTSEKIQGVVAFASNAILVLGEGSLYAYSVS